jgi:hypothetical protein
MTEEVKMQETQSVVETHAATPGTHGTMPGGIERRTLPAAGKSRAWLLLAPILIIGAVATAIYFLAPRPVEHEFRRRPKVVPVTVAVASTQAVPIQIRTTGNIAPFSTVQEVGRCRCHLDGTGRSNDDVRQDG